MTTQKKAPVVKKIIKVRVPKVVAPEPAPVPVIPIPVVESPAPVPVVTPPKPAETPKSVSEWFAFIQDFADKLTIKRILLSLLAGIVAIAGVLTYENRNSIFTAGVDAISNQTVAAPAWEVTDETKTELTALVHTSPLIKLALITEVDLQKNRRIPRWWYLEDPNESQIRLKAAALLAQPVFDLDSKNTQQMVSVLNNEFSCVPYSDTIFSRLFGSSVSSMPVICRLAIPPFYGRFTGILTFGLEVIPSKEEQDSLRLEASKIAVEIYLRDVVKKQKLSDAPK